MVSPNVRGIASQFDDMVEDRDIRGFVALAGIGALGGVLAEMYHDRIAPRLNQPANPSGARGLFTSFLIKASAAVLLAFLALRMSGGAKMALAVLGVGAAVDAGVDMIESVDVMRSASPTQRSPSRSRQSRRQPRKVQRSSGQSANSQASTSSGPSMGDSLFNEA